jgi:hypothetical protein
VAWVRAEREVRSFLSACFYDNHECMAKSISDNHKKRRQRGRPKTTGTTPMTGVRLSVDLEEAILGWAEKQTDRPNKAEAIRRLLEQALAGADTRPMGAAAQQKAVDLASREIDKMDDQSATSEERGQRKRRLVKGPREFRGDRPKGAK